MRLFAVSSVVAIALSLILLTAVLTGYTRNTTTSLFTYAAAKSGGHHHNQQGTGSGGNNTGGQQPSTNSSQGQQQGTCPDGSQPDANGNCPSTQQQQQQQQQQLTQTETGNVYVQVSGGNKTAQDFTLHIVVTSGQGSANPSDFQGSESGTTVTFSGGAQYDLGANQDPDYTRTYGSDCPATGSQFPSSFTCHVIYTYNPSTTSSSGTPPSSTSTSTQTPSSSTTSSSQQPLTNLVPQAQRLNPGSTNSTSSPSTNSTSSPSTNSTSSPSTNSTSSSTSQPHTNLAPLSPPITQGAMTSNKTTQQPHPITSITPQSKNATNSTTTAPSTTTSAPSTLPGNQTTPTNSSAGLKTFYVYVHMNNQGGGTKTVKDVTVSFPSIFKGEPCGITGRSGSFKVSPDTFPGSETGTPVKVSAAADFCAPPGTNLDFGNGYQLQYPVKSTVKSTVDSDCFLLPQSGACHMTLNYIPTSTGTTNNPTPLGPQKPNSTTSAKMTPSTHPGATTNTNTNNNANTNTNTNTNSNANKNTNTNTNTNLNTNTNTNANINTNTIINRQTIQNTVKINNEVNNVIRTTSQAAASTAITTTTSPSSKGPLVDLETVRLGKSTFPSAGIRPLADISPFQIIGGHVSLNSPSPNVYVIVAQITDKGVQHAVIVDLKKTASGIPGETLYHTDLGQTIIGTNPFTGKVDTASHITDLLLYNNNKSSVQFNDDSELTMTIIYR